jgi:hypothetical protein
MGTPTLDELKKKFEGKMVRIRRTSPHCGILVEGKCEDIVESKPQPPYSAYFGFRLNNDTHIFPIGELDTEKNIFWATEDGGLVQIVLERIIRASIHQIRNDFRVWCEICHNHEAAYVAIADEAKIFCCGDCQRPARAAAEVLAKAL